MTHKISLEYLREVSHQKPEGYYDDVVSRGTIDGDVLTVESHDYDELRKKYSPQLPSAGTQAKNVVGAIGKSVMNPKPVSTEERERRLGICNSCEFLIEGKRCEKCGCYVNWKTRLEAWHCPIGKW
jgi:hypothetical protein